LVRRFGSRWRTLPLAIDTNADAAFKRGDEVIVDVLKHAPDILVCATVLDELLAGFAPRYKARAGPSPPTICGSPPVVWSTARRF
jgi:hypothetical protein